MPSRPIVVVTGANNGVGFGICRRLLFQLALPLPSDALPVFSKTGSVDAGITYPCEGLTIIMACRSRPKAEAARAQLYELFDTDIENNQLHKQNISHVQEFRRHVEINIHQLDLASVKSVLGFCSELKESYPYVSHIICNAGVAPFLCINWAHFIRDICTNLLSALTNPRYNIQEVGRLSSDKLGWVWQCNVFGHYVLARTLEPLLAASSTQETGPGRVIWMSSLEAFPEFFNSDDWQLLESNEPYQASKYQMDLVAAELNRRAIQNPSSRLRHIIVHPGVVHTSIDLLLINSLLHPLKRLAFYLARLFGSVHHNITSWNGAAAAVHAVLVSLAFLPAFVNAADKKVVSDDEAAKSLTKPDNVSPAKIHSITTLRKNAVDVDGVREWNVHSEDSTILVDRCEKLYQSYLTGIDAVTNK